MRSIGPKASIIRKPCPTSGESRSTRWSPTCDGVNGPACGQTAWLSAEAGRMPSVSFFELLSLSRQLAEVAFHLDAVPELVGLAEESAEANGHGGCD